MKSYNDLIQTIREYQEEGTAVYVRFCESLEDDEERGFISQHWGLEFNEAGLSAALIPVVDEMGFIESDLADELAGFFARVADEAWTTRTCYLLTGTEIGTCTDGFPLLGTDVEELDTVPFGILSSMGVDHHTCREVEYAGWE